MPPECFQSLAWSVTVGHGTFVGAGVGEEARFELSPGAGGLQTCVSCSSCWCLSSFRKQVCQTNLVITTTTVMLALHRDAQEAALSCQKMRKEHGMPGLMASAFAAAAASEAAWHHIAANNIYDKDQLLGVNMTVITAMLVLYSQEFPAGSQDVDPQVGSVRFGQWLEKQDNGAAEVSEATGASSSCRTTQVMAANTTWLSKPPEP
jgi:hypothetical protein